MKRSKKIVVISHCILNVNSKVQGLALYPGAVVPLITGYIQKGYGIIQLPCPEMTFIGIQRWGMSQNQYDCANYRRHCRELVTPYVEQIENYQENGYVIEMIIGVDGSPSCGINLINIGYKGGMADTAAGQVRDLKAVNQRGILMEEMEKLLDEKGIKIRFDSISEKAPV